MKKRDLVLSLHRASGSDSDRFMCDGLVMLGRARGPGD